ncbi:hypothetical protein VR41_04065 [Streptomyces sp. NRRL B-1568]|nr:hypothetical protein VR41_04065 [Streptomyces sp. NRRL B-1568]
MHTRHVVGAALGGLLLALTLPTGSAEAAKGTFVWEGPKGHAYYLQNPPDGKCYSMNQEARAGRNQTDVPMVVYTEKNCKGKAYHLAPDQQAPRSVLIKSLIFNRR